MISTCSKESCEEAGCVTVSMGDRADGLLERELTLIVSGIHKEKIALHMLSAPKKKKIPPLFIAMTSRGVVLVMAKLLSHCKKGRQEFVSGLWNKDSRRDGRPT